MERIKPPSELDIDSLKELKEAWELYGISSGLHEKDDAIQIATTQSILEIKARRVLKTLPNIPVNITEHEKTHAACTANTWRAPYNSLYF